MTKKTAMIHGLLPGLRGVAYAIVGTVELADGIIEMVLRMELDTAMQLSRYGAQLHLLRSLYAEIADIEARCRPFRLDQLPYRAAITLRHAGISMEGIALILSIDIADVLGFFERSPHEETSRSRMHLH